MGFKANMKSKSIKRTPSLVEKIGFTELSQARLRISLISTVQSDRDINRHFLKFRGKSFGNNIDEFMKQAQKGDISKFIPGFPIRFNGGRTLSSALKELAGAFKAQERSERNLVAVTAGLSSGNEKQIALARAENLAQLQIALKAAIMAKAAANVQKKRDVAQVYNDPAFVDYYATLGTKQELTQAQAMKRFGINQTHLANATNKVSSSLKNLKGALADKFRKALNSVKAGFGLVSTIVPVKNNILPPGFKAVLADQTRLKMAKRQAEKDKEEDKRNIKRRKEQESRKKALAKKKTKKSKKKRI